MKTWYNKVQDQYESLENLKAYDANFNIAKRCGYKSCKKLWDDNPMIGGSVYPEDFGIVKFDAKVYWKAAQIRTKGDYFYCCTCIRQSLRGKEYLDIIPYRDIFCELFNLEKDDFGHNYKSFEEVYPPEDREYSTEFRVLALLMAYQFYKS